MRGTGYAGVSITTVALLAAPAAPAAGQQYAITVSNPPSLQVVNLGTSPPTPYGPFALPPAITSLGDVRVSPDGRWAVLVANHTVCMDLSVPTTPVVVGSIPNSAAGWAFTPDSASLLLTVNVPAPALHVVDPATCTIATSYAFTPAVQSAFRMAISPDAQTVVVSDLVADQVVFGRFDGTGLVSESSLPGPAFLGAVWFSSDGATVATVDQEVIWAYSVPAPGVLVAAAPPTVPTSLRAINITADPVRSRFYVHGRAAPPTFTPTGIVVVDITGPGELVPAPGSTAVPPTCVNYVPGTSTVAVAPVGGPIVVANLCSASNTALSLVDPATLAVTTVPMTHAPRAVDAFRASVAIPTLSEVMAILLMVGLAAAATLRLARAAPG